MLAFFKANPEHFDMVFVANATAAIKLVADGMRGSHHGDNLGFWYGYHAAAHTSLVGIREIASEVEYFNTDEDVERWLSSTAEQQSRNTSRPVTCERGLFAYPAQSNMNGRRLPLSWPGQLRRSTCPEHRNVYTLLDAAAYVTTAQLDLSDHLEAPDFIALSLHKIFGFPDLGALIIRKGAGQILLQRGYFGGGTVDMVVNGTEEESWHAGKLGSLHEVLEDGTPPFHSIFALEPALQVHRNLYGDMTSISEYTCRLGKELYDSMSELSHGKGVPLCWIYKDPSSQYGDSRTQGPTIAFNIRTSAQGWVKKSHVEQLAVVNGIQLRTGGLCNPGGIKWALDLTVEDMKENYAEGLRCGNGIDELNGKPTGVIRVSLGAMSNRNDIRTLINFLRLFIEGPEESVGAPRIVYQYELDRAVTMTSAAREPKSMQSMATEASITLEERPTVKSGDLRQEVSDNWCPVASCTAAMKSEEELSAHFQVHKIGTLHGKSPQGASQSEPQAKTYNLIRTAFKQARNVLCHR